MSGTDYLREMAYKAEDEGKEVFTAWHDEYDIIQYVEVDGVETYNDDYKDELDDAYWVEDAYRVAERMMY